VPLKWHYCWFRRQRTVRLSIIKDTRTFKLGYEDITTGKENVGRPRKRRKDQQQWRRNRPTIIYTMLLLLLMMIISVDNTWSLFCSILLYFCTHTTWTASRADWLTAIRDTCSKQTALTMSIQSSSVTLLCTAVGHKGARILVNSSRRLATS
jgi:hypothetical protein